VPAATTVNQSHRPPIPYGLVILGAVVLAAAGGLVVFSALSGESHSFDAWASYPGLPTRAAEEVGYFLGAVAGGCVVGARALVVVGARPDRVGKIDAGVYRAYQLAGRAAIGWALIAVLMVFISTADGSGVELSRLLTSPSVGENVLVLEQSRAWIAVALCAALAAVPSLRWVGQCVLLLPALVGVVAEPVTGNVASGNNHDYATSAVIVFWVALATVLGVKAAMLNGLGRRGEVNNAADDASVRHRLDVIVVIGEAVALIYGAVLLAVLLPPRFVTTTDYGRMAVTAAALLAAVLVCDAIALIRARGARTLTVPTFVLVVGAVAAISVMATRPAPGLLVQPSTPWSVLLGYRLPYPPDALRLLTTWRFDPLLGVAAVIMAIAYLVGVRRLRRRGDRWPAARTASWVAGCVGMLVTSSSGLRAYGSAMFSVHMAEHMVWNMFLPALLVMGAPVTLALRALPTATGSSPGPREWLTRLLHSRVTRFVAHPVVAFLVFVVSLYVVYFTRLFDTLVRYHWGHEVMSIHFLVAGYLFFWLIIGVDPGPRQLPYLARVGLLFAIMPFHAFFGIAAMTMTTLIGGTFYRYLALPWIGDLHHDQSLGGAIAWGTSELPVMIVVVALVAQWARHDRRQAEREDRHADSAYADDELAAYNAMLAELARGRR
jgi:cytochrome c oxidase assembly factor CtaG